MVDAELIEEPVMCDGLRTLKCISIGYRFRANLKSSARNHTSIDAICLCPVARAHDPVDLGIAHIDT
jgi:hypothetical protein